jgi:hypothetical protein
MSAETGRRRSHGRGTERIIERVLVVVDEYKKAWSCGDWCRRCEDRVSIVETEEVD